MAAAAAATEYTDELCAEIKSIDDQYHMALGNSDPDREGAWWESTGPAIINMYSAYLIDSGLVLGCAGRIGRQSSASKATSLINLITQFGTKNKHANSAESLMKMSPQGRKLIEILKEQERGIAALKAMSMSTSMVGRKQGRRDEDGDEDGEPTLVQTVTKRRRDMSGGAMSPSTKKALANIILAGALATGAAAAIKYGGMKILTGALVEWLSPAFQDNSHCLTVFGYWKNKIGSAAGMAKSCQMIASENASAADWVVTRVQLAMGGMGLSASIGIWGTWTRLQNSVIRFIIDPIDNFMTKAPSSKSIVSKVLSAQVALSAVKAYDAADLANKAVLKARVSELQLFFNKPLTEALATDNAAKIPADLDVIVVLPGAAAPPEDARGSVLNDEYRALFFEAIDTAAAPTTGAAATSSSGAAATSSSGAAASTGGKKKRKTMKKKHHKKRNKKHARKTGKKKMHKKKGKKTAKKHHKKHNKKHHKKRGRKTRKH